MIALRNCFICKEYIRYVHRVNIFRNFRTTANNKSDEDDSKPQDKRQKNKEAMDKLKALLEQMAKPNTEIKTKPKIVIPKPNQRKSDETQGMKLAKAASNVAEALGGDTKKTEMELLELYLSRKSKKLNEDTETVSSTEPVDVPKRDLNDLVSGMKVEKVDINGIPIEQSRAYQLRKAVKSPEFLTRMPRRFKRPLDEKPIDLFGEQSFDIFKPDEVKAKQTVTPVLDTWQYLQNRELRLSITHPPANIYEQMILWTEQGKIWRFPIDNEQDWQLEKNVDFTEHVFLEPLLESWCPDSGPVRHFMELVCVALSKNPFYTAQEKRDHIKFYEEYFRAKKDLLRETNAGIIKDKPVDKEISC